MTPEPNYHSDALKLVLGLISIKKKGQEHVNRIKFIGDMTGFAILKN